MEFAITRHFFLQGHMPKLTLLAKYDLNQFTDVVQSVR